MKIRAKNSGIRIEPILMELAKPVHFFPKGGFLCQQVVSDETVAFRMGRYTVADLRVVVG